MMKAHRRPTPLAIAMFEQGMTAKDLAVRVGITERAAAAYRRGERMPPIPVAIKISWAVGRPCDELWMPAEQLEELKREFELLGKSAS